MHSEHLIVVGQSGSIRRRLAIAVVAQYVLLLAIPLMSLATVAPAHFAGAETGALALALAAHWMLRRLAAARVELEPAALRIHPAFGATVVVDRTMIAAVGVAPQRRGSMNWLPVLTLRDGGTVPVAALARSGELAAREEADRVAAALELSTAPETLSAVERSGSWIRATTLRSGGNERVLR